MASVQHGAGVSGQGAIPSAERARFAATLAPLVFDGRLDEPSWLAAPAVTRFFEIYPASVGAPPASTEARFLYDAHNVYVGVRAFDPQPSAIRAPLAKRDSIGDEQDYAEIVIDTMNARRSALVFRTNVRGVVSDAQFNEATQVQSYAPDFDFDVRTSVDATGWSAEFRIPLSTLRYETGDDRTWAFMIFRGYPRQDKVRIASAPIPRGAVCQLCFAGDVDGISLSATSAPLSVTPHIAYNRSEVDVRSADPGDEIPATADEALSAGLDVTWQPRPDSVVDFTVKPDFSQVEADAVQLTANERFALFLQEKRPFFLEGVDLLSTSISAIYTRSFTAPDLGARLTHRGDTREFTVLSVRDAGGGSVIEPGATASQVAVQDFESTALAGRYRLSAGSATYGLLTSARLNDGDGSNLLVGIDAVWSPSASDRLVAQLLWSRTENPDRPDLLPAWTGQELGGAAGSVRWEHRDDTWFADVAQESYSHDFRAWNGFVPQVGVSRLTGGGGLTFYPRDSFLIRMVPSVQFSRTEELGGGTIGGSTSIGLELVASRTTALAIAWRQGRELTLSGVEPFDSVSVSLSMSPVAWIPTASIGALLGEGVDFATGEVGDQRTLSASLGLRFLEQMDLHVSVARQELGSRVAGSGPLLTDIAAQATATWHFSGKLYAQILHQHSTTERRMPVEPFLADEFTSRFTSLLLSLQTDWRTRFFVGVSHGVDESRGALQARATSTEGFLKFTYAFSMNQGGLR